MTSPALKPTLAHRARISMQRYILRGLAVVVPAGITVYAVMFCYRITAAHLAPFLRRFLVDVPEWQVPLLAMAIFLAGVFLLGSLATVAVGRRVIELFEWMLRKIPIIKSIYGATRQLMEIIAPSDSAAPKYQSAVLVPFPDQESYAIGLVTGTIRVGDGIERYKVFVVTTPNPTSGYLCFYPPEQVLPLRMSVDEVVESVTSGGVLFPEELATDPGPAAPVQGEISPLSGTSTPEMRPKEKGKKGGFFKTRFVSGILLIVPLVITVMVLEFLFNLTVGKVKPLIALLPMPVPPWAHAIVAAGLLLAVLWLVGVAVSLFIFRKLLQWIESALQRIPLVAEVYKVSKQVVEALADETEADSLRKMPVLIDFPSPGVKGIGFVSGISRGADGPLVRIFCPTTPNVSVGILLLIHPKHIRKCLLAPDEALRVLLSVGVLGPDTLETEPFPETFLSG
ncbi:MAG TPA: DUF502 domain-containing protein [Candidatus Hydrogenedentes bacterium]|nr:DUF502 domain-containing protein [Candidatus Hydrogenedentota bacterium]HOK89743.1 DUF502 domain-containing protein [Candidatus Hydrogenedentota bacterium]